MEVTLALVAWIIWVTFTLASQIIHFDYLQHYYFFGAKSRRKEDVIRSLVWSLTGPIGFFVDYFFYLRRKTNEQDFD